VSRNYPFPSQAVSYLLNRETWLPSLDQLFKHFFEGKVFAQASTHKQALHLGSAGLPLRFFSVANLADCSAVIVLFFFGYYFAFIAP